MRTYSPEVPEVLWSHGLNPDSSDPEDRVHGQGLRVEPAQYVGDDRPEYHAKILDAEREAVGDGWGRTVRNAFLAAVADWLEPEDRRHRRSWP